MTPALLLHMPQFPKKIRYGRVEEFGHTFCFDVSFCQIGGVPGMPPWATCDSATMVKKAKIVFLRDVGAFCHALKTP